MQHATFTTARSRLMPLAALLLAAALGGCVGYSSYPSRDYSYSYPGSYYAGYPQNYGSTYGYRPYYSPNYGGTTVATRQVGPANNNRRVPTRQFQGPP
jgi:hypothetical protein